MVPAAPRSLSWAFEMDQPFSDLFQIWFVGFSLSLSGDEEHRGPALQRQHPRNQGGERELVSAFNEPSPVPFVAESETF